MIQSLTFEPRGPFSLRAAAEFAFGPSAGSAPPFDGALRLAFAIDGGDGYAGVVVRQPGEDGRLECEVQADGGDLTLIERQVARVLSLDHDGEAFLEVGRRDPVIGELQRLHPGPAPGAVSTRRMRRAAWSVISARRQPEVRRALAQACVGSSASRWGEPSSSPDSRWSPSRNRIACSRRSRCPD